MASATKVIICKRRSEPEWAAAYIPEINHADLSLARDGLILGDQRGFVFLERSPRGHPEAIEVSALELREQAGDFVTRGLRKGSPAFRTGVEALCGRPLSKHNFVLIKQEMVVFNKTALNSLDCCPIHKVFGGNENLAVAKMLLIATVHDQHAMLRRYK